RSSSDREPTVPADGPRRREPCFAREQDGHPAVRGGRRDVGPAAGDRVAAPDRMQGLQLLVEAPAAIVERCPRDGEVVGTGTDAGSQGEPPGAEPSEGGRLLGEGGGGVRGGEQDVRE